MLVSQSKALWECGGIDSLVRSEFVGSVNGRVTVMMTLDWQARFLSAHWNPSNPRVHTTGGTGDDGLVAARDPADISVTTTVRPRYHRRRNT